MPEAKHAAAVAYGSLLETLGSVEWCKAFDDEDRAWLLLLNLSDVLAPLSPVHIPTRRRIVELARRLERDEAIRREFDGTNYEELARAYRLTARQVRRITKRRP